MALGFYRLLVWLALPLLPLRLLWRARREPAYARRLGERFGRTPPAVPTGAPWVHAVSAGETIAAAPLVRALGERLGKPVLLTSLTPAGAEQARRLLSGVATHCYAPYDHPLMVRAFLRRTRPRALILMETELWPNLIHEAHERRIPVLLVNARLSARSARRYARIPGLTRAMLDKVQCVACQYPDHARRFQALGAHPSRLHTLGNIKFDASLPADHASRAATIRAQLGWREAPVWIAASTHAGEESIILAAHRILRERLPASRLLLAPRHPARSQGLLHLIRNEAQGLDAQLASRWLLADTQHQDEARPQTSPEVVIADSMGLLQTLYGVADAAFIGGSLNGGGGHNPIEAALCRLPIIMGPSRYNFDDVAARFAEAQCLASAANARQLAERLGHWLADAEARHAAGSRALSTVRENAGALNRMIGLVLKELQEPLRDTESAGSV